MEPKVVRMVVGEIVAPTFKAPYEVLMLSTTRAEVFLVFKVAGKSYATIPYANLRQAMLKVDEAAATSEEILVNDLREQIRALNGKLIEKEAQLQAQEKQP